MKKLVAFIMSFLVLIGSVNIKVAAAENKNGIDKNSSQENSEILQNERKINFTNNWKFNLGDVSGAEDLKFNDSKWRSLDLPHDWSIELDFNKNSKATHEAAFLDGGTGWYRKTFKVPNSMKGKKVSIDFDGVYMESTVYVNGEEVIKNQNGYTPFGVDITNKLKFDGKDNVIAVKVKNTQPSSRWYSGSGIYRNVYLTVTNDIHVAKYGTFVTTPNLEKDLKRDGNVTVNVKTKVSKESEKDEDITIRNKVLTSGGNEVSKGEEKVKLTGKTGEFKEDLIVKNPKLWGIYDGNMYKLVTEIVKDGKVIDTYETPFGFRYFKFDADKGFSINGKHVKLKGVCRHHDLGALGSALNYSALERQVEMLKDMGVNAIRSTHNPASPEFIDICEKNGILVIDEAFDCWEQGKKTYDYHRFFREYAKRDIQKMVDSAKNSPAVIMWSIGNEIYDTNTSNGVKIAKNLVKWVKEIDTTRPTTIGEDKYRGSKAEGVANYNSSRDEIFNTVDVVGYNYSENVYDVHHKDHPNWKMYGSETSSAVRSRGVYLDPNNPNVVDNANLQCSSYDNTVVGWGRSAEDSWIRDRDRGFIAGQFIWTGFDYLGEPTPFYGKYPAKSSYFGAIDTAGFKKDIFYFYQSQWSDKPMVHILPHWNFKEGEKVQVWAYSNADTVELFLNGKSLGERKFEKKTTNYGENYLETKDGKLHLTWDVKFKPGTLKAVAKKNGVIVAEDEVKTAGQASGVKLTPEKRVVSSEGKDLTFITADIVDKNGVVVPNADNLINFEVTGGKIVGVDNGNGASVERYKANKRKAFNGKALVIIEGDNSSSNINVKAVAQGLDSNETTVYPVKSEDMNKEKIVGLEKVSLNVDKGNVPKLPRTVKAIYANNTEKDVLVTWDSIDKDLYNKVGTFKVNGNVKNTDIKAEAEINVRDIVGVKPYSTVTKVGVMPKLPSEATVIYSDGKEVQSKVTWEEIDKEKYSKEGNFIVYGKVELTDKFKAEGRIRVTNKSTKVNIAAYNSEAKGKAFASFTNPADDVNNVNDGVVSYNNNPANRWTNWQRNPRKGNEYVGIEWKEKQNIDNMNLYVYADSGCQAPESISVEYLDYGGNWKKVSNMKMKPESLENNTKHEITFDKVKTNKIRVVMTPRDGKSLALTEIEIMDDVVVPNSTAKLSSIAVNGKEIEGFKSDNKEYEVTLPYGSKIPEVKATSIDNGAETVILPTSLPGECKILVTSEDGKTTNEYKINFKLKDATLQKVEISADKSEYTEDEVGTLNINALLESGEKIDLNKAKVSYISSNENVVKIKDGKLNILGEGSAKVRVSVTYNGVTKVSNELEINSKKSDKDKIIVGFTPIKIVVNKGEEATLPETVEAKFNVGLPRDKKVTWDKVDPSKYKEIGKFKVYGNVSGTSVRAVAEIEVKGVVSVENISSVALINEEAELPSDITVYYSDNTEKKLSVKWDKIPEENYKKPCEFKVYGSIEGLDEKAVANVRVSDKFERGLNVSRFQNGYDYPRVQASYSNEPPVSPSSEDRLEHVHNDIISFGNDPHDRWTNWKPNPDKDGWVSVEFGRTGKQEYYINEMTVYYFTDSGVALPKSAKVQYEKDGKWIDVKNQKVEELKSDKERALPKENVKVYKFDKVKASKMRIFMEAKPNKSLGITEIQIFKDDVIKNSNAYLKSIKVNGKDIKDFNKENLKYTINVEDDKLPKITAEGVDNEAVTIVEPKELPGKGKVIVKGEDGVKTNVYELDFVKTSSIDKSSLKNKIDEVKKMDLSKYTDKSKSVLNEALQLAEKINSNKDATKDDVNNGVAFLNDAVKNLKEEKQEEGNKDKDNTGDKDNAGKDEGKDNIGKEDSSNKDNNQSNKEDNKASNNVNNKSNGTSKDTSNSSKEEGSKEDGSIKENLPKTGKTQGVEIFTLGALFIVAGIFMKKIR